MPGPTQVTAAEIARLARVSRTTVSNWRRRHEDFPGPVGGTDTRPTFDRAAVEAWLRVGERLPEATPFERIWYRIQAMAEGTERDGSLAEVQRFLLYLERDGAPPGSETGGRPWRELEEVDDAHLAVSLDDTVAAATPDVPGSGGPLLLRSPEGAKLVREIAEVANTPDQARELSSFLLATHLTEQGARREATPDPLASLMAELAGVDGVDDARVLDPACGLGTLLAAAADRAPSRVRGQELDEPTAWLSAVRLARHHPGPVPCVSIGDALLDDAYRGESFDAVLCHPPFGQRDWGAERLAVDERWAYGTPPRSEPELAWVQHCLAHARPGGRVVMLLPPAVASRGSGRRIRAELLRRGALRAVVGLPPGAAQPSHVPLHLWVLESPGSADTPPPTRLLMLDSATEPEQREPGRADAERRSIDWGGLHGTVVQAVRDFTRAPEEFGAEPGRWRSVPVIELLDETVDLTPARHLPNLPPRWEPQKVLDTATDTRARLARDLRRAWEELPGRDWAIRSPDAPWRLVAVADLLRSGALELFRASSASAGRAEEETAEGPAVLTLADVKADRPASGTLPAEEPAENYVRVAEGDVALPASLSGGFGYAARVTTTEDAEAVLGRNLHLLRPDPDHLDSWFLAGFLGASTNLRQAGYGSTITRVDPRRLRLPLLSVDEQRGYGRAFREMRGFEAEIRRVADLSAQLTTHLADGLRGGALLPPSGLATEEGQDGGQDDRIAALDP